MFLEDEVDNGYRYNSHNIRCKTWAIVIEVLTLVVVLEERQSPHLGILIQNQEWQHKVIPEPESIDNQSCRMHGLQHWKNDSTISCKTISPIDFRSFIQTIWYTDFYITNIQEESLWNSIS